MIYKKNFPSKTQYFKYIKLDRFLKKKLDIFNNLIFKTNKLAFNTWKKYLYLKNINWFIFLNLLWYLKTKYLNEKVNTKYSNFIKNIFMKKNYHYKNKSIYFYYFIKLIYPYIINSFLQLQKQKLFFLYTKTFPEIWKQNLFVWSIHYFLYKNFFLKNCQKRQLCLSITEKSKKKKIFFHVNEGGKKVIDNGSCYNINKRFDFSNNLYRYSINFLEYKTVLFFLKKTYINIKQTRKPFLRKKSFSTLNDIFILKYKEKYQIKKKKNQKKFRFFDFFNLKNNKKVEKITRGKNKIFYFNNFITYNKYYTTIYKLSQNWDLYLLNNFNEKWYYFITNRIDFIIKQANFLDNIYFIKFLIKNSTFSVNNKTITNENFLIKKYDWLIVLNPFRFLIYKLILKKFKYNIWLLIWYFFLKLPKIIRKFKKKIFFKLIPKKEYLTKKEIIWRKRYNYRKKKNYKFLKRFFVNLKEPKYLPLTLPKNKKLSFKSRKNLLVFFSKNNSNLEINYRLLTIWLLK